RPRLRPARAVACLPQEGDRRPQKENGTGPRAGFAGRGCPARPVSIRQTRARAEAGSREASAGLARLTARTASRPDGRPTPPVHFAWPSGLASPCLAAPLRTVFLWLSLSPQRPLLAPLLAHLPRQVFAHVHRHFS